MSLTSGTPIWLSFLLTIAAVLGTHFLTRWREQDKRSGDFLSEWRTAVIGLLQEIIDEAIEHYTNAKSIEDTRPSSQRILNKLKRLGIRIREVQCNDAQDTKKAMDLIQELRDLITSPDDFQSDDRVLRAPDDALMENIRECEERLLSNLQKSRKMKG